jgi:Dolichyl-phosphate-mannose-protein mannosyltransferase
MILHLLGLVGANCCFLAAGVGLGRPLGLWSSPAEIPARIAPLYLVGLAASGLLAIWALMAGLSLAPWQVVAGCGLLAAAGALPGPAEPLLTRGRRLTAEGWPVIVLAACVGLVSALLLVDALYRPLLEWDSWAMWTMKARAIVLLGGLDPHLFAGSGYRQLHLDYPLLLPALEAIDFRFMGELDTQVVHVQPALAMVALLFSVPQILRGRVPAAIVWASVLLLAVAPSVTDQAASGLADAPLAVFFAAAALWAWRWLADDRPQALALCALFAAAALSTKREGGPFVAALFVVLVVAGGRARWRWAAGAGAVALAAALPWQLWLHANAVNTSNGEIPYAKTVDPGYLAGRLGRIPTGTAALVSHSVRPQDWLLIVPLAAVAVALAVPGEGRGTAVFVAAVAVLVLASVAWAYWVGRPHLHYYITHTAKRVVTTPVLVLAVLLPLLIAAVPLRSPPDGSGD